MKTWLSSTASGQKLHRVSLNSCQPTRQTTENNAKNIPSSRNIALRDQKILPGRFMLR